MKSSFCLASLLFSGCSTFFGHAYPKLPDPEDIKIFSIDPDGSRCPRGPDGTPAAWCGGRPGLIHLRSETWRDFKDAKGWAAETGPDLGRILGACPGE